MYSFYRYTAVTGWRPPFCIIMILFDYLHVKRLLFWLMPPKHSLFFNLGKNYSFFASLHAKFRGARSATPPPHPPSLPSIIRYHYIRTTTYSDCFTYRVHLSILNQWIFLHLDILVFVVVSAARCPFVAFVPWVRLLSPERARPNTPPTIIPFSTINNK